jgi:16S rRNA (uracil1498-N3)-methyltransferase
MQFTYHPNSGDTNLTIDGELHNYLFKVRRTKIDQNLHLRNLEDDNIYEYQILSSDRRKTKLILINTTEKIIKQSSSLHIGWCVVDTKTIEKMLPSLNELGVEKISFIYCEYSQKQFKLNIEKLNKLLINSSQQSGRSSLMILESYSCLDKFIEDYPETFMFNFSTNLIDTKKEDVKTILIGCEGGFSQEEVKKIDSSKVVGIKSNLILRSETAVVTVASKILV